LLADAPIDSDDNEGSIVPNSMVPGLFGEVNAGAVCGVVVVDVVPLLPLDSCSIAGSAFPLPPC